MGRRLGAVKLVQRTLRTVAVGAAGIALVLSVGATPAEAQAPDRPLRVMTRNLYLGADLSPALGARTAPEFFTAVAGIYASARTNTFSVRAAAVAAEIDRERPDLIGLQEVSRWEPSGPENVVRTEDYLRILQRALAARGLDYHVAAVSVNAVIGPVPLISPCGSTTVGACLITFTDRDVILVNRDSRGLRWWNPEQGNFAAQAVFTPPVPGAEPVSFNRGWASIDGRFRGERFHFVNTHLEVAGLAEVQRAQAGELLAGPAFGPGADLVVGDINSAPDGSTMTPYALLTAQFRDAWSVRPGDPGYTCCQPPTLTNPTSQLSRRIDLILVRGARPVSARVVGAVPFAATPPFWASDHAGVVAALQLGERRPRSRLS
jgi:endonuclease/exonuclease/phosphatase family metal-dependent hydrolase